MIRKKVVLVGDGACGKTSLSVAFSKNEFPENHIPTIYDQYSKFVTVDGHNVELSIWDTAGEEDYDRLRPLSYSGANVIIICFAIDNPISLKNVYEKWAPEIKYHCHKVPIILVGNKLDLRNSQVFHLQYDQGMKIAKKIKACDYIECSAKCMMRIQDVFLKAAQLTLIDKNQKTLCKCC